MHACEVIRALKISLLSVACVLGFTSVASAATLQVTPYIGTQPTSANCSNAQYVQGGVGSIGGGDRICYQAIVNLSDVRNAQVNVQLPSGVNYDGGFQVVNVQGPGGAAASQTQVISSSSQTVAVRVGAPNAVISNAQVIFRFAARGIHPEAGAPGENKATPFFSQAFVGSTQQQLAGQVGVVGFEWSRPNLGLQTTVATVNGSSPSTPSSVTNVEGGSSISIRNVEVNNGNKAALNTGFSTTLPSGLSCADVTTITNSGTCSSGVVRWSVVPPLAANSTYETRFTVVLPNTVRPADKLTFVTNSTTNYGVETNLGVQQWNAYYIQPASASVTLRDLQVILENTSDTQPNNNGTNQVTPGEQIIYTVNVVVPRGTRLKAGDKVALTFDNATQIFYGGTSYKNDAGVLSNSDFQSTSSATTLTLPTDFVASNAEGKVLVVRANTRVAPSAASVPNIAQTASVTYGTKNVVSNVNNNAVVNPGIQAYIGGFGVAPNGTTNLSAQVYNANSASTAYDSKIVIQVAPNLTPLDANGNSLASGQATTTGLIWNVNDRTLTLPAITLAPGQSFNVQVPVKAASQSGSGVNVITARTWSYYDHSFAESGFGNTRPGYYATNGANFSIN